MNITAERARELVTYDPVTGSFAYKSGKGTGGTVTKDGYLQIKLDGTVYRAHRIAWLLTFGDLPPSQIDHRNGDRLDNRIVNLRCATAAENAQNVAARRGTASRHPGVTWHARDRRWQAQIRVKGRLHFLGHFVSEDEAAEAYLHAKRRLHQFQPTLRSMGEVMGSDPAKS